MKNYGGNLVHVASSEELAVAWVNEFVRTHPYYSDTFEIEEWRFDRAEAERTVEVPKLENG